MVATESPRGAAGVARVSTVALRWSVHDDMARALLARRLGCAAFYAWEDVWRIEGASYVPPSQHEVYRAPMIAVERVSVGVGGEGAQPRDV